MNIKLNPEALIYTCFSADFLIEEAGDWRQECWKMIKERFDCQFIFLTKRILRFKERLPSNWATGMIM